MSSQFFVKFQYQDKIKKIGLFPSDLTWDYITNIISRSFSISPSRIRLTYKDPEGDEITACCDQDLLEAYRASPNQQMLRFFIYKASLNTQNSMPMHESASKRSLRDDDLSNSSSKKSKSLCSIKDSQDPSPEKRESIIISQEEKPSSQELKLSSQEIKDLLKTLLNTTEAKKAIQDLKHKHNLGSSSTISSILLEDKNLLEQIFCESLTAAFNESPSIPREFFVQKNIPEVVVNPAEIDFKSTIISRGSYEEEKEELSQPAKHKLDFEKSLLDSTLKETIYERSQGETLLRRTLDKNQASMRTKSLSSSICCKDLTSSYGVKLALQYENGKMRLLSIPSGEYTIIDSIGANKGENGNAASQIKKSYTVDVLPRLT